MCNEITLYSTEYLQKCFYPENTPARYLQSLVFLENSEQQHFVATVIYMTSAYIAFCACCRNIEVYTNVQYNKISNSDNLDSIALYF